MDIWATLWPNPHPDGKVHKSVYKGLIRTISPFTRFETIIRMVMMSGISDLTDQIATARALRDKRNEWRESYNPHRKAICAK